MQPQEVRVLHDTAFMFWSPVQDEAVIRDLEGRGERLYLEGYRPRDKYRTETKIGMHSAHLSSSLLNTNITPIQNNKMQPTSSSTFSSVQLYSTCN